MNTESNTVRKFTISRHANKQAFLKAALLASVPINAHDGTVIILKAFLVLDVLLYAPSEKTLKERTSGTLSRLCKQGFMGWHL